MTNLTRRAFAKTTLAASAATALSRMRILGANDRINIGLIACGDRAMQIFPIFLKQPDVLPVAVCDVFDNVRAACFRFVINVIDLQPLRKFDVNLDADATRQQLSDIRLGRSDSGAYDDTVLARLRWFGEVLGPTLDAAVRSADPMDLRSLTAQALQMGDEGHNRNVAATSLFVRSIAPTLEARQSPLGAARTTRSPYLLALSYLPHSVMCFIRFGSVFRCSEHNFRGSERCRSRLNRSASRRRISAPARSARRSFR